MKLYFKTRESARACKSENGYKNLKVVDSRKNPSKKGYGWALVKKDYE